MALGRLTATQVKALGEGRHADGGNLFLHVKGGKRYWKFITKVGGRRREHGLGAFPSVTLAEARQKAARLRVSIAEGHDPFAKEEATAPVPTFGEAAEQFIASMEAGWKNDKHRQQWRNTLATYAAPIRDKPVAEIGTDDVLAILTPIWSTKPETASRVRGRIERVLDFAKVRGWRDGMNPAMWRGHLALTLPAAGKLRRGHHGAMPYQDVPAFMAELSGRKGIAALALRFAILTAGRSGEVRGATWSEIDTEAAVWTVPGERMKAGREHRVPLTDHALAILDDMRPLSDGAGLVFPGTRPGKPMSDMTLAAVLKRMKRDGITVHGFRSSFSTWCAECTDVSHEVREAALAHAPGDRVAAAYNRSDHFKRRRELMDRWAVYCTGG